MPPSGARDVGRSCQWGHSSRLCSAAAR